MPPTISSMLALGTKAPQFRLPDPQGKWVSPDDFPDAPALLVGFICNHCPYVKHIRPALAKLAVEYQERGVAVVAISSNDVIAYPDDSPEKMAEEIERAGYTFPYLYDESQGVAKAYRAVCTPDFFLSIAITGLFIAGSSMIRGLIVDARRREPICGRRWIPFLPGAPLAPIRNQASAAG